MTNKVTETKLNGEVTTILDVSTTTAAPKVVGVGYTFVDKNGEQRVGQGTVVTLISNREKFPDVKCVRYRYIPTQEEYKSMFNFQTPPDLYHNIAPLIYQSFLGEENQVSVASIASNDINDLRMKTSSYEYGFLYPIYDNQLKGWVLQSVDFETVTEDDCEDLGLDRTLAPFVNNLIRELKSRFGGFVYPSKFLSERVVYENNEVFKKGFTDEGNRIEVYNNGILNAWKFSNKPLGLSYRICVAIANRIRLFLPKFLYEFAKWLSIKEIVSTDTNYDITKLCGMLAKIREGNHIDTTSIMHSANTPEVVTGKTPQEVLDSYMSSVFKSETNREDNYTEAIQYFNNSFDELVGQVAYTCFIPNMR